MFSRSSYRPLVSRLEYGLRITIVKILNYLKRKCPRSRPSKNASFDVAPLRHQKGLRSLSKSYCAGKAEQEVLQEGVLPESTLARVKEEFVEKPDDMAS
jgi:hypothetical protein